ncbi:MAG: right-handed parallel beta-helix repeat-containing protein [Dysgonamonadaceae bacterium]|jgi:hypothetical protein|nr:right-handed parallel beta-helix repeat-containing protein [Dysgonamonadaceae bacterium]
MKKISFFFILAITLLCVSASSAFAQDPVYYDFDRANWVAQAPPYSPTDAAVDGNVAGPEYLLDDNQGTFLALVKPGKSLNGVTGPATIQELGFTIDFNASLKVNYFRILFRNNNSADYIRPWQVSIYGSNGTEPDPANRTWTQIQSKLGANVITLPNAEGEGGTRNTGNLELDNTQNYTSIKVVYEGMSPSTSGNSLQVAEFFVGRVTNDRVIDDLEDLSFGDVLMNATSEKTLVVGAANLNNPLTYTLGSEPDAAAFTLTPGAWESTGGTVVVKFAPTAKKAYATTLTINSVGALAPKTINLTGNADFDLPVEISNASTEKWYYIQFARQSVNNKVLEVANPSVDGDTIVQSPLNDNNVNQQWKFTGTWDNYVLVNKSGKQMYYAYAPKGQDPGSGDEIPEINRYVAKSTGDKFGFIRYQTTDTWQLKNTSSSVAPDDKLYLNDISGEKTGGYSLNNAGNQLVFIPVDQPRLVVADTVRLGSAKQYATDTVKIAIGAVKITSPISVAITGDAENVFVLNTTTLPSAGGEIEILFTPNKYKTDYYADITLTSGSLTKSFVLFSTSKVTASKYYVGGSVWGTRADGDIVDAIPALKAGDEVWIASGEYTVAQIGVPADVAIYGGFAGTETSVSQRAKGSKAWEFTNAVVLKNSAALVMSITGANTIIDGITFEGTSTVGRAIQNTTSTATNGIIRNCIMKNFTSNADGGAMNIRYKTEIYNCLITGNKANKGGAAYLDNTIIHDCEITNNSVPTDILKPIGNQNGGGGGLLLAPEGSGCRAYNLLISGNTASFGGGVFVRSTSKLYNSIIVENTAAKSGSGITFDERDNNSTVYNVTVANNHAGPNGAGICFAADGSDRVQKLYNAILFNNTDTYDDVYNIGVNESGAGKAKPEMKNIIIDDVDYYVGENPNLDIVFGVAEDNRDKLFVTDTWVTVDNSPGIDKGIYTLSEATTDPDTGEPVPAVTLEFANNKDFAGKARIYGSSIDIGPYEYSPGNAIAKPNIAEGKVIATTYYNIQGMEIAKPVDTGIYIKKDLMENNSVRVTKILFLNKK